MFQVGGTCYATKAAALGAAASSQTGAVVSVGGSAHVVSVSGVADNGIEYTFTPVGGGSPVVQQVLMEPPECGLLTVSDVNPIVWAVAAGWALVFVIKAMWRARVEA